VFKTYSAGFKAQMVKRLTGPDRVTPYALGKEVGIDAGTLSRWLRAAATVPGMEDDQKIGGGSKRPRDWSPEERLRAVSETAGLDDAKLGEYLRQRGLHSSTLNEWRALVLRALAPSNARPASPKAKEAKQLKAMERELHRKDKALAEYAALIALKKKVAEIWGDEGESTRGRSDS
jgi:transposase-like protein